MLACGCTIAQLELEVLPHLQVIVARNAMATNTSSMNYLVKQYLLSN